MGATISQDHSVAIQSSQTSADPCVLCRRRREVSPDSPTMDRRYLTHASPHFSVPVLRWTCCVPLRCQSHDLQVGVIVGWPLHGPLTGASRASQYFVMTAHITHHFHCQCGTLLLGHYFSSIGFFDGSIGRFDIVIVSIFVF